MVSVNTFNTCNKQIIQTYKNSGSQGNNIVPYNSKLMYFLKKILAIHQEILQVVQNIVSASKLKLLSCTLSCHFKESEHIVTTVQKQQTSKSEQFNRIATDTNYPL